MQRTLEQALLEWHKSPVRIPLLIRGARQVGKTFLIEAFARAHFKTLITINFEFQPEFCSCFDSLVPQEILEKICLFNHQKIIPEETLLFLDEIQECPRAIGIRISEHPLSFDGKILSLPFYLVSEWKRLVGI
ncbi:MAG: AAA family ATPase [Gammaproteobacteria bacterium]|nr:AAA family ATPase [Gammaproteobacteria bacterium]